MDYSYSMFESCGVESQLIDIEGELDAFRNQWRDELRLRAAVLLPGGDETEQEAGLDNERNDLPTIEDQASYLFQQGVNAESNGQLYIAIRYYRRAVQLVPDIEFRVQHMYLPDADLNQDQPVGNCEDDADENEAGDLSDLLQHFSRIVVNDGAICQANFQSMVAGHISHLPVELLMYLFKWVVSSHLDTISLEHLSQVCRGFYLCARDEELWKLICQRIWGLHTGSMKSYKNYRNMYLLRPHLRYNGVYLAKTSYYRQGERGLDSYYHPYHLVDYYRYLHFFADGHVLMFTSPDDPASVLPRIRSQTARIQGLLYGIYRLTGDQVTAVLRRMKNPEPSGHRYRRAARRDAELNDESFHLEFLVQRSGRQPHAKLVWDHYSNQSVSRATGQESSTEFDLNNKSFPPLIFCRVKSYTSTADSRLQ